MDSLIGASIESKSANLVRSKIEVKVDGLAVIFKLFSKVVRNDSIQLQRWRKLLHVLYTRMENNIRSLRIITNLR